MSEIEPVLNYLKCRTPDEWVTIACENQEILLLDHAANELKAAQSAMTLMARNPTKIDLLNKMSRLAREELVHFEQVLKILKKRGMTYRPLKAGSYAASLAKHIRKPQAENFVDTLIVGSIIEARSCERFDKLAPYLDEELAKFYRSLLKSESRHFRDYLALAQSYSCDNIDSRVDRFLDLEAEVINTPDSLFRFHSGLPVARTAAG